MERRNAQVWDVEITTPDESVEASTPTLVVSAAPLQACVRASAPTVRVVPVSRLPGTALGTVPPAERRARMWVIEEPLETAPVGAIPLPGERAIRVAPRGIRAVAPRTRVASRAPMRACEPQAHYSVEREISAITTRRPVVPQRKREGLQAGHALVLIVGVLAGLLTVLSVVVFRQQRDMQSMAAPAHRADEACAAYAAEVRALARELTRAAGDVAAVEQRIGARARGVAGDRAMQRLCDAPLDRTCSLADVACVAATVMQLRQALARR